MCVCVHMYIYQISICNLKSYFVTVTHGLLYIDFGQC